MSPKFDAPMQGAGSRILGDRMQLGYVVEDMDEALRFWTQCLGVGPFVVVEDSLGSREFRHRGVVSPVKMTVALSYHGETQIELISQQNRAPSPYLEFLDSGQQGLHHVAFMARDFLAATAHLDGSGYEEVSAICLQDGSKNLSYHRAPPHHGSMIELLAMTAARTKYYEEIRRLACAWDGSDPVRKYLSREQFLASRFPSSS